MNRFGREAMLAWQTLAPARFAQLEDPSTFFAQLGQQAEDAWLDLSRELAGADSPGEPTLAKLGRLTNARLRAEEIIRAEYLMPPTVETPEAEDEPDPWAASWERIRVEEETIRDLEIEAEIRARRGGDDDLT